MEKKDWPQRLRSWVDRQPAGEYFGIVGGGEIVEAMRRLDEVHLLDPKAMHWRCIELLDATWEIATELIPEFGRIELPEQFDDVWKARPTGHEAVRNVRWVRIGGFYSKASVRFEPSPEESWSTTSDTLALYLAALLSAQRCVLLKSCETAGVETLEQAMKMGIVDEGCIRFSEHVPNIELHTL